jgi:hypothetical protein
MAQVTLNKKSWHFEYYSYVVSDTPPKSLCPYFWTMVAITILSPLIGLMLLFAFINKHLSSFFEKTTPKKKKMEKRETAEEIIERLEKDSIKRAKRANFWNKVGDKVSFAFRWIVFPLVVISLIYMLFQKIAETGWIPVLIAGAIAIVLCLVVVGFTLLVEKFGGKIGNFILKVLGILNPFSWKITNIIGEMIKTAYTKACPLITWEEKSN